jgi:large subunit ribosomal protein L25
MSEKNTISAVIREDVGKGASRRLRREDRVPAVLYGGGQDPVALTLEHREVLHAAESESFFSSILEIQVDDGRRQQAVIRDLQRHPYKPRIVHVDFLRVSATEKLRISLPLHFTGEEASPAGREGGVVIQHLVTELEIEALPGNLPEFLEVDLSALEPGGAVMLAQITLPEGVEFPAGSGLDPEEVMLANAIHISESQGTGAAAAEEAEALAAEEAGELAAEEGEEVSDEDEDAGDADGDAEKEGE